LEFGPLGWKKWLDHYPEIIHPGMEDRVDPRILNLVATVIDACAGPGPAARSRGHPPAATVRVVAALWRFVREGTPWRGLAANPVQASGSTLRRRLQDWARTNLLQLTSAR
jgi:hypothetical protein